MIVFFFFQAEDGIRDDLVTGVQTCALPIYSDATAAAQPATGTSCGWYRCSSRRVDRKSVVKGKSVDLGGRRIIKKKNTKVIAGEDPVSKKKKQTEISKVMKKKA